MKEEKLLFIKSEEITDVSRFDANSGYFSEDYVMEEVCLELVVSAFGIDNWEEPLTKLPGIYLEQLISGELKGKAPVLIRHNGVYIGIGVGNRTIAVEKLLGKEKILAHVLQTE